MIINTDEVRNIYISSRYVDMRKSIDGLALIVHSQFQMNVLDTSDVLTKHGHIVFAAIRKMTGVEK